MINPKYKDIVSMAIVQLFDSEMFYAELIARMRRIISTAVPTAGVCIKDDIELHINLEWFGSLPPLERVAVLKHECEHILRDHIPRFKEIAPEIFAEKQDMVEGIINGQKFKTLNISADLAINGMLKNLPKESQFPVNYNLPNGETFEWYLEKLKNNDKAKQEMEFDGHELWSQSTDSKEVLKEKIRHAVNKAAQKTRAAGRMTSEHELLVSKLNTASVNWREQLQRFVARAIETAIESSKKKRNRRYGIMYPGSIKTEELHIGVAIDTSGSMSDESLNQAMAEIGKISKYAKVTVVEADSEIKDSYVYNPRKEYRVKGRGGTAYQPAFTFFTKETDIDALIYIGDMDISDKVTKPKYPVLWAIVGNQNPPADFGTRIRVKVKNEV